jgi:hypothetical protein
MRGLIVLLAMAGAAQAGGVEAKARAQDYPQHIALPDGGAVGFEYHGRGAPAAQGGVFFGNHIVLEVAYFPPKDTLAEVRGGHFLLKIDKMKFGIGPESPGMVAASLKYADWEQRRGLEVGAGPVVYRPDGRPSRRFPGGPAEPEPRRMPDVTGGDQERPDPQEQEAEAVKTVALPEGPTRQVVAGYLYYRWGGNLKKMKKLVVEYAGAGGPAEVEIPLR